MEGEGCLSQQISTIKLSMGPWPAQWHLLPSLHLYNYLPIPCAKQQEPRNTGLTNYRVIPNQASINPSFTAYLIHTTQLFLSLDILDTNTYVKTTSRVAWNNTKDMAKIRDVDVNSNTNSKRIKAR